MEMILYFEKKSYFILKVSCRNTVLIIIIVIFPGYICGGCGRTYRTKLPYEKHVISCNNNAHQDAGTNENKNESIVLIVCPLCQVILILDDIILTCLSFVLK